MGDLGTHRTARIALVAVLLLAGGVISLSPSASAVTSSNGALGVPAFSSFDTLDNGDPVQVRTLSSRADLVSGGEAFIEVVLPSGVDPATVSVTVDGRDVSAELTPGGP